MSASLATSPLDPAPPPPPPTTFEDLLCCDVISCVVGHLHSLADIAAVWRCCTPEAPAALHEAALARAGSVAAGAAPLWSAHSSFAECALWPLSVPACDWHPRPFFAALRAPAYCRVAGSGACSHGLCQKQETPKPGVLELLEAVVASSSPAETGALAAAVDTTATAALECIAFLCGALGRNDAARRAWSHAAAADSPRAQLDLGISKYTRGRAGERTGDGDEPPRSASSLLLAASRSARLPGLGLEGLAIKARALVTLGMMHLDGDGAEQDDAAAVECFQGVVSAHREAKAALAGVQRRGVRSRKECTPLPTVRLTRPAPELPLQGEAACAVMLLGALRTAEEDAREVLETMDRFTFFANGRP